MKNQLKLLLLATAMNCFAFSFSDAQDDEAKWWRGNLHTHSLWSDGDDFPEMIAKWYVDHDYNFLALTDHNVLSVGNRWMDLAAIEKRAGKTALEKYIAEFGEDWVERRDKPLAKAKASSNPGDQSKPPASQVRLRPLSEFRGKFEVADKFLMIQAEEISDRSENRPIHMNAMNLQSVISPVGGKTVVEAINNNLRAVQEQADQNGEPIMVHLNHPNFGWAVTAEELAKVTNEKFFELYNGHPSINHLGDKTRPGVEKMWDICNTLRISEMKTAPMFGLATDDSHNYHTQSGNKARSGRGWIMVRANQLNAESLIGAINQGEFYSSSGVELESVKFDQGTGKLSLEIKPQTGQTFRTSFIGTMADYDRSAQIQLDADGKPIRATRIYSKDVGKEFKISDSLRPEYQMTGNELFVRAVVTSSRQHRDPSFKNQKEQAWTQPVVWTKTEKE
ncbi:MAG: hypothetical protein P8J27_15840 [Mariniblastus sp.]|nr:hypothetical protein [Mariniblastus sp.]